MEDPNILFLFTDQHRGDWLPYDRETFAEMGMEKLPLNMPNMEKLMSEGLRLKGQSPHVPSVLRPGPAWPPA